MVYGCSVVNCKGNYNKKNACRVFRLPKKLYEKQIWIKTIPSCPPNVDSPSFRICERHWPQNTPMLITHGGISHPKLPPSIFNVPQSCLPTPKPPPRKPKMEYSQQSHFDNKDKFETFTSFSPKKELHKKYNNVMCTDDMDKPVFVFMDDDLTKSLFVVKVYNEPTLLSPVTIRAFKNGLEVIFPRTLLNTNRGINRYSQFFAIINFVVHYKLPVASILSSIVHELDDIQDTEPVDADRNTKLKFLSRQLQLLAHKNFTMSDYCLAMEFYPKSKYEHLRQYLVFPCEKRMRSVISSVDTKNVLEGIFSKVNFYQKHCMLIIDEVKIRPTVSYCGGFLSGFAENEPGVRASSILAIMMKCLHGGPSVMVCVKPVHHLTADYQFQTVKEMATVVESCGGVVLGSVTDNHRINQRYCKLFNLKSDHEAVHPLDKERTWHLLYDTVHLFKCIRNNWLSEKCRRLSLDNETVGAFADVQHIYEKEKDSILRSTPLTFSSVYPTPLQLQNVKHVVAVFNDKVVAALMAENKFDTAALIFEIVVWWKTCNVASNGENLRFNDPDRSVQTKSSTNLQRFVDFFKKCKSGQGSSRVISLTNDTKRALVQTMEGLVAVCKHLYYCGF